MELVRHGEWLVGLAVVHGEPEPGFIVCLMLRA
jgi:hypothetical protein